MRYFLTVLGMVMIVEGLPYFVAPDRMKAWLLKIMAVPGRELRVTGFLLMAAGLVLVYFGRQG